MGVRSHEEFLSTLNCADSSSLNYSDCYATDFMVTVNILVSVYIRLTSSIKIESVVLFIDMYTHIWLSVM